MASNIDVSQLSASQQEALAQYTAVTNQEVEAAIPLLQRSQWNVQIAIAKFFDGEQPDPVAEAQAQAAFHAPTRSTRRESLQESLARSSLSGRSFAPRPEAAPRIVPQPDGEVIRRPPYILGLLFSPFRFLFYLFSTPFRFVSYLFPVLPRLLGSAGASGRLGGSAGRRALNPRDTAARFIREFSEEYGPNELPFYENGYARALDEAKKDLKFLLVVLLSPEHDDTAGFVRDTLLSPEVVTYIKDPVNNIILWGGNVRDSEAYQVSTALRCTKFPSGVVIAHTPSQGATAMSVVGRLAGTLPPSTYLAKLQTAISGHAEELATVRNNRAAQEFERGLRQQQDSAYERSLAQDRERLRLRREEEARRKAEEQRAREEAEKAEIYAQKLAQWKRWRAASIRAEPTAADKNSVRIALKMPETAQRVTRRFDGEAPIEELYAFVECYDILSGGSDAVAGSTDEPTDFKHEYKFRIVSPMPRAVYGLDEGGSIAGRVGRSANLIVEPIEEEDEDGAEEGEATV